MFKPWRPYDETEAGAGYAAKLDAFAERLRNWAASVGIIDLQIDQRHRRYAAIAFAVVLNSLFVWIVVGSLKFPSSNGPREIHLTLASFTHADVASLPRVPEPTLPVIEPPEISIQTDVPASAPSAAAASSVLAPRPDPSHPNPLPAAAEIGAGSVDAVAMILKIMVLPDGSVTDAIVVKSSGRQETDMAAIAFVKSKWRFLPALLGGNAIQYWTTVSLRTA